MGRGVGADERIVDAVWRVNDGECLFVLDARGGRDGACGAHGVVVRGEGTALV